MGRIPWNKGLKNSQIAWNKGLKGYNSDVPRTKIWRERISLALSGSRNGQWNGGIARKKYPFSFNKQLKDNIRLRDNHICQICLKKKRKMDVHHIDYDKNNCNENNLILLCASCHIKTNPPQRRKYYTQLLSKKAQRLYSDILTRIKE